MKKLFTSLKFLLVAVCLLGGGNSAWADRVYFNDFSTGNGTTAPDGLTIHGGGTFVDDADANFGKVFQNGGGAQRTHYLQLPNDVLSHSKSSKKMTIGFWVNAKNAGESASYMWAPLFMAYAAAPVNNANTLPMFACQYRGVLQINNAGWCDYVDAQNVNGTNAVYHDATDWLADKNWHYYTVVFDGEIASVYFDGVLKNQWDATTDYNNGTTDITDTTQDGLYTAGSDLTYVCLGGNQAWGWGDNDAAFMFDDFAVYDEALSPSAILGVMTAKTGTTGTTAITVPSSFNFNAADATINPFDQGTIVTGTNVKGLNVNNTTATAWFDSDASVDGNQAYALSTDETVTVQITALHGWLTSGAAQGVKLLNSEGNTLAEYVYTLGSCNITDVKIGGSTASGFTAYNCQSYSGTKNANGFTNNPYSATAGNNPVITFTVGYDGYVTLNITKTQAGINNTYTGNLPAEWAKDLQKVQVYSGSNNSDRTIGVLNMNVSTVTAVKHTVTFAYVDADGNSLSAIKANETAQAVAGTSVASLITSTVTASFKNADESLRYDYTDEYTVTGDATEVPDGDITVTLKFAPKGKFNYTVRAVDGSDNVLNPNITSGYVYSGDNATITYPQYVLSGTTLYNIANNGSGDWYRRQITPDADGYVYDLVYNNGTVSDVIFYTEAEDISGMTSFFNNANRASNGYIAYSSGEYKDVTTLEPGKYKVYTRSIRSNSNTHDLNIKCGESVVGEFKVENGTNVWKNTDEFIVSSASTLAVASAGGSQAGLDFLYIVKTGDAAVTATIGATGWTTFASPYALNLSSLSGATAYYASAVNASSVTMSVTTQAAVAAGEGIMLKGTAGDVVSIPVVATGTAISGNLLKGCTAETGLTANAKYYVLVNNEGTAEFQSLEDNGATIPAGKAYLDATSAGARSLDIVFGDADGITAIDNAQSAGNAMFDLSGRRVAKAQKGIYIVNGKKVVK